MAAAAFPALRVAREGALARPAADAAGPETYELADFVALLRDTLAAHARIVHLPEWTLPALAWLVGALVGDVLLTREALGALRSELLLSHAPPTGHRRFSEWLPRQTAWLGRSYARELTRNWPPVGALTPSFARSHTGELPA